MNKATTWIANAVREWPETAFAPGGLGVADWFECQALRTEVEALLAKKP